MPTSASILEGKDICICAGSGGVGKTTTSAAIATGMAARGLKVCVLTIDPAKRLADSLGLKELGNEASRVDPALFARPGGRDRGRAVGDDARRQGDLRRAGRAPGARRGVPRPGARQPHLPADLQRARRLAGVHGDGEALRAAQRGPLRPARPRHAADPQRARLPRRAEPPDPVHRRPLAAGLHEADRAGGAGRRPRRLGRPQRHEADRRLRPDRRPGRVLQRLQRHGRRLPGARQAGQQPARRPAHLLPGRLRAPGRADRRGRLLPPQAGRGEAPLRRRDRQQGPLPGRAPAQRRRRPPARPGEKLGDEDLAERVAENFADYQALAERDATQHRAPREASCGAAA